MYIFHHFLQYLIRIERSFNLEISIWFHNSWISFMKDQGHEQGNTIVQNDSQHSAATISGTTMAEVIVKARFWTSKAMHNEHQRLVTNRGTKKRYVLSTLP